LLITLNSILFSSLPLNLPNISEQCLGLVCFVGAKTILYKILSNFTFQITTERDQDCWLLHLKPPTTYWNIVKTLYGRFCCCCTVIAHKPWNKKQMECQTQQGWMMWQPSPSPAGFQTSPHCLCNQILYLKNWNLSWCIIYTPTL
jgi:hypothetical protein